LAPRLAGLEPTQEASTFAQVVGLWLAHEAEAVFGRATREHLNAALHALVAGPLMETCPVARRVLECGVYAQRGTLGEALALWQGETGPKAAQAGAEALLSQWHHRTGVPGGAWASVAVLLAACRARARMELGHTLSVADLASLANVSTQAVHKAQSAGTLAVAPGGGVSALDARAYLATRAASVRAAGVLRLVRGWHYQCGQGAHWLWVPVGSLAVATLAEGEGWTRDECGTELVGWHSPRKAVG
jgi:hypothetical protein